MRVLRTFSACTMLGLGACAPVRAPQPVVPSLPPIPAPDTLPSPRANAPGIQWANAGVALSLVQRTSSDSSRDSVSADVTLRIDTLPSPTPSRIHLRVIGVRQALAPAAALVDTLLLEADASGHLTVLTAPNRCVASKEQVVSPLHARLVIRRAVTGEVLDSLTYTTCTRGVEGKATMVLRWQEATARDTYWVQRVAILGQLRSDSTRHFPMRMLADITGEATVRFTAAGTAASDVVADLQTVFVATAGIRRQELRQQATLTARTILTP